MTHSRDQQRDPPVRARLPEFLPEDPPELRVAAWKQLLRNDADIPESVLDEALVKLLDEIRLSL
jgi:hypothetical protein